MEVLEKKTLNVNDVHYKAFFFLKKIVLIIREDHLLQKKRDIM